MFSMPYSRKVITPATAGVNHWNLKYSAKGRNDVYVKRNLRMHCKFETHCMVVDDCRQKYMLYKAAHAVWLADDRQTASITD